jgi:hypothetical protein
MPPQEIRVGVFSMLRGKSIRFELQFSHGPKSLSRNIKTHDSIVSHRTIPHPAPMVNDNG